jgi:hypothetical protein
MSGRSDRTLGAALPSSGFGEIEYYRHGASPDAEFKLALKAILAACSDAGLDPRDIDGFACTTTTAPTKNEWLLRWAALPRGGHVAAQYP